MSLAYIIAAFEDLKASAWRSVTPPAAGIIVSPTKWAEFERVLRSAASAAPPTFKPECSWPNPAIDEAVRSPRLAQSQAPNGEAESSNLPSFKPECSWPKTSEVSALQAFEDAYSAAWGWPKSVVDPEHPIQRATLAAIRAAAPMLTERSA